MIVAEPWLGGSHEAWATGLAAHSTHDVAVVGLPARLWRWRLRAGAAPLAAAISAEITAGGTPDLLVVSGLVDVAALLGHLRLAPGLPVVVYQHESQLLYPTVDGNVDDDVALRNFDSWLAADQVWFNSAFHRTAVVDALPSWSRAQPEPLPVDAAAAKFDVVPVGVESPKGRRGTNDGPPVIVWPHRWEPDKAPDVFARALDGLAAKGMDFRLVLAGEDPAGSSARSRILDRHGVRVAAAGPFSRAEYERWLHASDIVVSCAEHEFFGTAVVEALMAGCVPVLPDALSYPELVPAEFQAAALYPVGTFGTRLADVVSGLPHHRAATADLAPAMRRFAWPTVSQDYDARISAIVTSPGGES